MEQTLLLNWYDVMLLVIVCIGAIRGWMVGLSAQLSRLAGLVFIFILILSLRSWGMGLLQAYTTLPNAVIPPLVILGLFAVGLAATAIIRLIIGAVVHIEFAPWAERLGGFTGGAVQMAFALFVITLLVQIIPIPAIKTHTRKQSVLGGFCHATASAGWRNLVESHPEVQDWADQLPVPVHAIFDEESDSSSSDQQAENGKDVPAGEEASPGKISQPSEERSFLGEIEDVLPSDAENLSDDAP
jgi:hypothetical protein